MDAEELKKVLQDRPGDQIYPNIKNDLTFVIDKAEELKKDIVDIILKDLIQDLALDKALKQVGTILEYISQDTDAERPSFQGQVLLKHFERISKLKLSVDYAHVLELDGVQFELMLKAEIERIWGDSSAKILKQLLAQRTGYTPPVQAQQTGVKSETKLGKF